MVEHVVPDERLGVRDLRLFNEVSRSKWLWRYMNEKVSLGRRVLSSTYGDNGLGLHPSESSGLYG